MNPSTRSRARFAVLTCCAAILASLSLPAATGRRAAPPPELQGVEGLVRVYDFILEARFDQADAELRRACGPAPPEACEVLAATALWWRILLDPGSHELDGEFSATVDRAIERAERWTERAPANAEAWFYLGAAYAARVQWRVLRNEKLSAARDGKRIKDALEQALELDPGLDDAHFGIGMYKYYADVAPTTARILRFLLLLPGGDRQEGLAQMLRARERGKLLQGEADYQLHIIYLWYESQTARALQLLRGLHQHYPTNPLFLSQIAEIQDAYEHDITASLATWQTLLGLAREQRMNAAAMAEVQARVGMARLLDALHQTDYAIEHLQSVVAKRPKGPFGALPRAHLRLGQAYDRLGSRAAAIANYRAAIAAAEPLGATDIRDDANARLRRAPEPRQAEAYKLSLEGFRLLERKDFAAATAALERSLQLNGNDPVARYRYGQVLLARKDDAAALKQFEFTVRNPRACPPPILGYAYLEAARLHERSGQPQHAINYYRTASRLFGAAAETRATASRALTRLRAR